MKFFRVLLDCEDFQGNAVSEVNDDKVSNIYRIYLEGQVPWSPNDMHDEEDTRHWEDGGDLVQVLVDTCAR